MIYLICHYGEGLKVFDFTSFDEVKRYIRNYTPLQYVIVCGTYLTSNL